jgi:hypothetical protein
LGGNAGGWARSLLPHQGLELPLEFPFGRYAIPVLRLTVPYGLKLSGAGHSHPRRNSYTHILKRGKSPPTLPPAYGGLPLPYLGGSAPQRPTGGPQAPQSPNSMSRKPQSNHNPIRRGKPIFQFV